MFIGLNNPRHSKVISNVWNLYLCNIILFSGDFSFIYDDYALKTGKFDQKKFFMHPDHCIAYSLYAHGIGIRSLSQFVDVTAVKGGWSYDEYVDEVLEMAELGKFAGMDFVYRI